MKLLAALMECHRRRKTPLGVKRVGEQYEYSRSLDFNYVAYARARDVIRNYPWVENLLRKWI